MTPFRFVNVFDTLIGDISKMFIGGLNWETTDGKRLARKSCRRL